MEKIFQEITGRTEDHLIWNNELSTKINKSATRALSSLNKRAKSEGFDLRIASAFRSFSRQEEIWNKKMNGERPILDKNNKLIDPKSLNPHELVFSILKWSAIPGTSRHHWGTDFDFIDGNALTSEYKVQLIKDEYLEGGIFYEFFSWLKENSEEFGFYFPYREDLGGVGPEPWHLSYYPTAKIYQKIFSMEYYLKNLKISSIPGKEILFKEADLIFQKYIQNTSSFNSSI